MVPSSVPRLPTRQSPRHSPTVAGWLAPQRHRSLQFRNYVGLGDEQGPQEINKRARGRDAQHGCWLHLLADSAARGQPLHPQLQG